MQKDWMTGSAFLSHPKTSLTPVNLCVHSSTLMKQLLQTLFSTTLAMVLLGFWVTPAHADLPRLRKALDELQAAKKSDKPMPLLKSARNLLNTATKGNKLGDRDESVEKINEAIAALKEGDKNKMTQKINAAIANLHQGKAKTN